MLDLSIGRLASVLCIGAHADDIEIGCGGTVLSLIQRFPGLAVAWVVLSAKEPRAGEARDSAALFLADVSEKRIEVESFRDGFFPYEPAVKDFFEILKTQLSPDLILTHCRSDRHQDHRTVSDLTWNSFRNHLILEYEIPKWDGDLGRPNVYMPLEKPVADRKTEYLMRSFASQRPRHWYDAELFAGLMRLRGMECAAPDRYAEAFWGGKLVLSASAPDFTHDGGQQI